MIELKDDHKGIDEIYDAESEQSLLGRILDAWYARILRAVGALVRVAFDLDERNFRVDDPATRHVLRQAAARVVRIDETTRQAVRQRLVEGQLAGYNNWQIAHGVPQDNYPGMDGLFKETWKSRPETVARTELQQAQLLSAIDRYRASGLVSAVQIIDGCQWDQPCCTRNGTTVLLEQAAGVQLNHPNCTVVVTPVLR